MSTATLSPMSAVQQRYLESLHTHRVAQNRFFATDPRSPLTREQQAAFDSLSYFAPDPAFHSQLRLVPSPDDQPLVMPTSSGDQRTYQDLGTVSFKVAGQEATLHVYQPIEGGSLFIPFRDTTSGRESYGAGRYLEPRRLGADLLLVDFNLAYNPWCAYNDAFSCPLPPITNWLRVPIRAGERQPRGAWVKQESYA
jgi:uncharacterized protein (DUF1684 family)